MTTDGAQALPADERGSLVAELRKHAQTRVEWRVADPKTGSYCIAFGRDWCLDPEHEAREWLRKHRAEFPEGRFVSHEVQRVEIRDPLDEAALEAADMLAEHSHSPALLDIADSMRRLLAATPASAAPVPVLTDEQIEAAFHSFDWSAVPHPFRGSVGFERGARWAASILATKAAAPQEKP